jgi:hypothetical protein
MHTQEAHSTSRRAYMTESRFFTFSKAQCTPHTHADQHRAPRYDHTTHTRAQTHDVTSPTHHNGTSEQGACHPKHRTPTSHAPHIAHAHTAHKRKPHTPARRPAQPQPLRTAQTSLHALRRTHATHGTAHSSDHPTHRPQKNTPSHTWPLRHTHERRVRFPSVDGMLPERWLPFNNNCLQDTRTAIASHHGTRRRRRPQPDNQ